MPRVSTSPYKARNHVQRQKSRVEKALCSIFLGTKRGRIVSKLALTACPSGQAVDPGTFEEQTECQGSRRARTWPRNHVQKQKSGVEKALCSIFLGSRRGRIAG